MLQTNDMGTETIELAKEVAKLRWRFEQNGGELERNPAGQWAVADISRRFAAKPYSLKAFLYSFCAKSLSPK